MRRYGLIFLSVFLIQCEFLKKLGLKSEDSPRVSSTQEATAQTLFNAALFFSLALDDSIDNSEILQKKYCGLTRDEISLLSMQVKARLDNWIQQKNFLDLPAVSECAKNCLCDLFALVAEADPNYQEQATLADKNRSQEDRRSCVQSLGDFCQSKLLADLKKSISQ